MRSGPDPAIDDDAPESGGLIGGGEAMILEAQRGDADAIAIIDSYAREGGTHSPAWHAMRRTGIGGSDVAALLGLNPWRKPIDVYAEKVGELEGFEGNERTRWGQILEPVIAEAYVERRGGPDVCHIDGPHRTARSLDNSWHLYTVDYLVVAAEGEPGKVQTVRADMILRVLEIKSRGFFMRREYGDEGTDEIPFPDLCQGAWYVAGVKCDGGLDLAALFNTHELRLFHADRDLELEGSLLEQCGAWWQRHVVARVPPDADGSDQYGDYLRKRFDHTSSGLMAPSDDVLELRDRLRSVECLARLVGAAKEKLRQQIQVEIGDSHGFDLAEHGGGKLTFKFDRRGKVNHSAVAQELAEQLKLTDKALRLLQDSNRYDAPRRFLTPRAWLKDQPSFSAAADELRAALPEPEPEPE